MASHHFSRVALSPDRPSNGPPADSEPSLDERNLQEQFQDQDLEGMLADASESQTTTESTAFLPRQLSQPQPGPPERGRLPRWMRDRRDVANAEEGQGDDVPESLLLEGRGHTPQRNKERKNGNSTRPGLLPGPVPGPSGRDTRAQWERTQQQQRLYDGPSARLNKDVPPSMVASRVFTAQPEKMAWYRWTNERNLDSFLVDVYEYYMFKGIDSMILARVLHILQLIFLLALSIILRYNIDWSKLSTSKSLREVWISGGTKDMSWFVSMLVMVGIIYFITQIWALVDDWWTKLSQMRDFYTYLLGISEEEIQTISWQEVVGRLMALRDSNPRTAVNVAPQAAEYLKVKSRNRMDAHDIANRIMRKDNYFIGMFNKGLLDLTLPIPFLRTHQFYSRNLEFNIKMAVLDLAFPANGPIDMDLLKPDKRDEMIASLQRRFRGTAFISAVTAPVMVVYYLVSYFLRYFKEFQSNPSQISSRAYAPMAEWKFREFNELEHFFRRRSDMSVPFAARYLEQFPKNKTVQISRFASFVTGSLLTLLGVASLLDPANFLNFEITNGRTVLFYIGALTIIWSVSRGNVPEDNEVFDPEYAIQEVINYTHYCPAHWKGRLHSDDVRKEFSNLFQMKIMIFLEETLSLILAPIILAFNLPACSEGIVDFFREFTIQIDGLGYVCSYAVFEFEREAGTGLKSKGPATAAAVTGLTDEYYASNDNKMLASYYSFIDNYSANQRRGNHRTSRHRFHQPPAFPGIASPVAERVSSQNRLQGATHANDIGRSRLGPQLEPSQSMLLDPNHQPTASVARRMQKINNRGHSLHPLRESTRIDEDDVVDTALPITNMAASVVMEEPSRLGDSWKMSGGVGLEEEEQDEDDDGHAEGVLGMIKQFSQRNRRTVGL